MEKRQNISIKYFEKDDYYRHSIAKKIEVLCKNSNFPESTFSILEGDDIKDAIHGVSSKDHIVILGFEKSQLTKDIFLIEQLNAITDKAENAKIILISDEEDFRRIEQFKNLGVDIYIEKSKNTPEQLYKTIDDILNNLSDKENIELN